MNLFRTEIIQAGKVSGSSNIGEIVTRNGQYAYRIGAAPFWSGDSATSNNIAKNLFASNTAYIFDLWIDVDDVYYDGISSNVPGGLTVRYTNNTYDNIVLTGNRNNPKGFQHIIFVSDATRTISGLGVYYYVGTPGYYRLDSYVAPLTTAEISKNGTAKVNFTSELVNEFKIEKGGLIGASSFIEY